MEAVDITGHVHSVADLDTQCIHVIRSMVILHLFLRMKKGNFTAYNSAYTDNTSENDDHVVQSQQKDEVQYTGLLALLQ